MTMNEIKQILISSNIPKCGRHDRYYEIKEVLKPYYNSNEIIHATGQEKSVVIFKNENFVLKIVSYCLVNYEFTVYNTMKRFNFHKWFAKPFEPFYINGVMYYFQEKISRNFEYGDYSRDELRNFEVATSWSEQSAISDAIEQSNYQRINGFTVRPTGAFLTSMFNTHGYSYVVMFLKVCRKLGINDFRNGNVGTQNGKIVCFDYSGYIREWDM